MNRGIEGDEKGNWTYIKANGHSVIDYVVGTEDVRESIERLEIGDRVDSDHQPLVIWIKGKRINRSRRKGTGRRKWNWLSEGKKEFRKELGRVQGEGKEVEIEWVGMKERILRILEKSGKGKGGERREEGVV